MYILKYINHAESLDSYSSRDMTWYTLTNANVLLIALTGTVGFIMIIPTVLFVAAMTALYIVSIWPKNWASQPFFKKDRKNPTDPW
jgi:hypothetical protein